MSFGFGAGEIKIPKYACLFSHWARCGNTDSGFEFVQSSTLGKITAAGCC